MKRVAGQPEKKYNYIKNLDEKQFPFLVADILYLIYKHTEIRIVDGPGDGKRDIISIDKKGRQCITQCKYHVDNKKSVSSRETDEIAIALVKFNAQTGIFATTGKLSPQAKREFTTNFTQYELAYLEGVDIVDLVLSSPILSSVWVNNESIELTSKALVFPFVIRKILEDKPISEINHVSRSSDKIINSQISKDYFYPYRSPKIMTIKESTGTFFYCNHLIYSDVIRMHQIDLISEKVFKDILVSLQHEYELVSLRIGVPFLASIEDGEIEEKLKLYFEPQTFIITKEKIYLESEYVIPCNYADCVFPKRFRTSEASWATWFFTKLDICLQIELSSPASTENDIQTTLLKETHLSKLNDSLFFILTKEQFNQLNQILEEDSFPNWDCNYGFDGHIVGWLHPYITSDSILLPFKIIDDTLIFNEDESESNEFNAFIKKIENTLTNHSFQICSTQKAINLSKDTSSPLFIEPKFQRYETAEIFHYFDDIPSPIFLEERYFVFICIWKIPLLKYDSDIIELINHKEINSTHELQIDFSFDMSSDESRKFGRLDIKYRVPQSISADNFIDEVISEIISIRDSVEISLKLFYPDCELSTEKFWNDEIGIILR